MMVKIRSNTMDQDQFTQDEGGATHAPEPVGSSQEAAFTQQPALPFVPGSLEFYGTVQSASDTGITVSMPDGQALALMVVPGRTDLSHSKGTIPGVGQVIKVHATAKRDGSFIADKLARARTRDAHELGEAEYRGVTTGPVGPYMVLHFQVGTMVFSFPISATADLDDFGHRAHAIGADESIEAEVQFQGTRGMVVEVERE
jgi:hypothetical protein